VADGTDFQIGIGVTGAADANSAAAAVAALADRLTSAGAASDAATLALKAGQVAYNQAETTADRAAKALERIGIAADAQKGKAAAVAEEFGLFSPQFQKASDKLAALTARQSEAASKASTTAAAVAAEAASLDKLKAAAATAADSESKLTKAHTAAAAAAKTAAKGTGDAGEAAGGSAINFRALSSGLGKLGGPLGTIGSSAAGVGGALQKLSKALGSAGPYVAAAVLAVALAAAFVVATLAITKFAITSADAARTQALLSDGIAGSVAGGRALDKAIDGLASKVPQTREELLGMAGDLAKSGLSGAALSAALEDAATKAAKLKYGPDFAKQTLSLTNQAARFHTNLAGLFSGVNIEGFLGALSKLVALFDANEASGKAIKVVFESLFQPVIDGLTAIIPKAISTFLQLEILSLKALIMIKPYSGILADIGYGFLILGAVIIGVVAIFVAAVALSVAAFAALLALPFFVADGFTWLWNVIKAGAGAASDWLTGKFDEVVAFLEGLSFAEIGRNLIMGLINGLLGAGPGVLTAITGIADGAVTAAKKALGIASPSKVFAEIGEFTGAGMAQGVDKSSDAVQGSLESMVSPPAAPVAGPTSPATGSKGGPSITGATFNFYGVEGAQDAQDRFLSMLEGLSAQVGSAAPHAP
jgi:hypothetical protein